MFVGLAAAALLRLVYRSPESEPVPPSGPDEVRSDAPSAVPRIVAALLTAMLWGTTLSMVARAAEAEKLPPPKVHSVFVPVNEHDRPVGNKCYVPEEFYAKLREGVARPSCHAIPPVRPSNRPFQRGESCIVRHISRVG